MTYARRYALTSAFNIATEDNDANIDNGVNGATDNSIQDTIDQTHSILQKLAEENKLSELETAKWICNPFKLNPEESQGWSNQFFIMLSKHT